MKVFSVTGVSGSGKTTVVEEVTRELTKRGYSVGTIKSIGHGRGHSTYDNKEFTIDTEGKNTYRHRVAGSKQVTSWAKSETAIIYQYRMALYELIVKYDFDYLIVEGGKQYLMPRITTGDSVENTELSISDTTFAVSGKIAEEVESVSGIKAFKTYGDTKELVDLIIQKVHHTVGYRDEVGCKLCGMTCGQMNAEILIGEKCYTDCVRMYPNVEIESDDEELKESLRKLLVGLDEKQFGEIVGKDMRIKI